MLKKGMKKSVISKKLGVNCKTVYNWSVKLEHGGDWHDRKQPGSKSKLTKDQKEKLKNLGYSAQVPVAVAMEKNPEYVKEWLEKNYPEYVKEAKEKNATILFQDESGVQSRPNVRRTWSPRVRATS